MRKKHLVRLSFIPLFIIIFLLILKCNFRKADRKSDSNKGDTTLYSEKFRPQYHFSPEKMWMNDPNGMVYYDGEYHLFYQYHPESMIWGPMHWGHAVSTDLFQWEHLPIALYPDELGTIFSGSAVVDKQNTSGFKSGKEKPIVAIFTHNLSMHAPYQSSNEPGQYQSIAFSNDKGYTWTKYENNPVIPNPGVKDFRDPKVIWHDETNKWIVVLACGDHVNFYSSPNLKDWHLESEFGRDAGAHGGVWECPDLFSLPLKENPDIKKWILIVSINSGAPNGGSGTQYFVGEFDGHKFKNKNSQTQLIDYGTDNFAGVTWSNVKDRIIFLGWMSNWTYADKVPTNPWRGAMTLPRKLSLSSMNSNYLIISEPVMEINKYKKQLLNEKDIDLNPEGVVFDFANGEFSTSEIEMDINPGNAEELYIKISNNLYQYLKIGYKTSSGKLYIDRT